MCSIDHSVCPIPCRQETHEKDEKELHSVGPDFQSCFPVESFHSAVDNAYKNSHNNIRVARHSSKV